MIDIIIPAYNAHNNIENALHSIALQSISDKINTYIIDDNSIEDYTKICNKFSEKINIKQLKTSSNIGPGGARQFGMDNTNGEYILFLDSDDVLYDYYSMENLYNSINLLNLDIVMSPIYKEDKNHNLTYHHVDYDNLHGKIFRRSFLQENDIRFVNNKCNEDTLFLSMARLMTDSIYIINNITYIYKYNNDSITNKASDFWLNNLYISCNNGIILYDFIEEKVNKKYEGACMLAAIVYFAYKEYINNIDSINIDEFMKHLKPFYIKSYDLINTLDNDKKTEIYFNICNEKIPKISFEDFEKLIISS